MKHYKEKINVNPDIAFYKPIRQTLADIESKMIPIDFSKIEFEDAIENYNLKELSPESVTKIIEIIRVDEKNRYDEKMSITSTIVEPKNNKEI